MPFCAPILRLAANFDQWECMVERMDQSGTPAAGEGCSLKQWPRPRPSSILINLTSINYSDQHWLHSIFTNFSLSLLNQIFVKLVYLKITKKKNFSLHFMLNVEIIRLCLVISNRVILINQLFSVSSQTEFSEIVSSKSGVKH